MHEIAASSTISEPAKAAARRDFYRVAMHNTLEPWLALVHTKPTTTSIRRCAAITLRQHELEIYLRTGGQRPRRASI